MLCNNIMLLSARIMHKLISFSSAHIMLIMLILIFDFCRFLSNLTSLSFYLEIVLSLFDLQFQRFYSFAYAISTFNSFDCSSCSKNRNNELAPNVVKIQNAYGEMRC